MTESIIALPKALSSSSTTPSLIFSGISFERVEGHDVNADKKRKKEEKKEKKKEGKGKGGKGGEEYLLDVPVSGCLWQKCSKNDDLLIRRDFLVEDREPSFRRNTSSY